MRMWRHASSDKNLVWSRIQPPFYRFDLNQVCWDFSQRSPTWAAVKSVNSFAPDPEPDWHSYHISGAIRLYTLGTFMVSPFFFWLYGCWVMEMWERRGCFINGRSCRGEAAQKAPVSGVGSAAKARAVSSDEPSTTYGAAGSAGSFQPPPPPPHVARQTMQSNEKLKLCKWKKKTIFVNAVVWFALRRLLLWRFLLAEAAIGSKTWRDGDITADQVVDFLMGLQLTSKWFTFCVCFCAVWLNSVNFKFFWGFSFPLSEAPAAAYRLFIQRGETTARRQPC